MFKKKIIGNATLYFGDSFELLQAGLFGKPACVLSDPPYGINYSHGGGSGLSNSSFTTDKRIRTAGFAMSKTEKIAGDDAIFDPTPWIALSSKSLFFGADHFRRLIPDGGSFIAWDKSVGQGPHDSFVDCEFAWTNVKVKRNVIRHLWKGILAEGVDYMRPGIGRLHVSQKPFEVMRFCLETLKLRTGSLVVDPFMGSGSTAIPALSMGHSFIGCDIEEKNFDIACKRIEKFYLDRA